MKIYARQRHRVLQVVTKLIVPFVLLFALYVQFHGDYGPGGGFQAGVIFAAAFILHGLIFGLQRTRRVVTPGALRVLMAGGVLLYAGTGVLSMLLGGNLLDYDVLAHDPLHGQHWGIFAVELGVGITVTGVMISLFYGFASRRDIDSVAPLRPDADVGVGRLTSDALEWPVLPAEPSRDEVSGPGSADEGTAGERTTGEKAAGEKASAEKATGKETADKETAGKKTSGKKAAGKKVSAKKTSGRKTSGEKAAGKKATGKNKTNKTAGKRTKGKGMSGKGTEDGTGGGAR